MGITRRQVLENAHCAIRHAKHALLGLLIPVHLAMGLLDWC